MTSRMTSSRTNREISTKEIRQRVKEFARTQVKHPSMLNAMEEIQDAVSPNSGINVALLVGPPGVGKSATCEQLIQETAREYLDQLKADPFFNPAIMVSAPSLGDRAFSMADFFEIILEALGEPMIDQKLTPECISGGYDLPLRLSAPTMKLSALRVATGKALQARQTRYVIVDEAAHIMNGRALSEQVNALKSLSDMTQTKFVLVGSYDLYEIISVNGQLARRCHVVHLPRYTTDANGGKRHFNNVARALAKRMNLEPEVVLDPYLPALMEASVGCIGTLKHSLQRAYSRSLRHEGGRWSPSVLQYSLLRKAQTRKILNETLDGERLIAENEIWSL
ncbi:TniB family NTP-binding protein [Parvibaculum sp. MBR-TMA-1.3b-4.2]